MRLLTYILVGIGAAIAVVALAVVLLDDGGPDVVEPQADNGQSVTATASPPVTAIAQRPTRLMIRNRPAAPASPAGEDAQVRLPWKSIWRR